VYVAELGPVLVGLASAGLPAEAQTLRAQLARAAAIKPVAPTPGRVNWMLNVGRDGAWTWADPRLSAAATQAGGDPLEQVRGLLALRRHLGWEVVLAVNPDATVTMGALYALAEQVGALRGELADLMQYVETPAAPTNRLAVGSVVFDPAPVPASLVLRVKPVAAGTQVEFAAREPAVAPGLFRPEELGQVRFAPLPAGGLTEVIATGASPVLLVLASDGVAWKDVRSLVQPALARGQRVHVAPEG
jgi:hypothetical protein